MVKLGSKVNIPQNGAKVVPVIEFTNDKPKKRSRAWFLALLMFGESCGMLAGCSLNNNASQSTPPPTISSTNPVDDETKPMPLETEPVYDETVPIPWEERVLPFLEQLEQVPIKYKYEEDYPSESDIQAQMSRVKTTTQCDYKYEGGAYEVLISILENTFKYVSENKDCELPFLFEDEEDEDKGLFPTILEKIIEKLLANSTNNLDEDICTLKDYAIVYSYDGPDDSGILATTYFDEKVIKIYPNRIRKKAEKLGVTFEQYLSETLEHEINHVRSALCDCREEKGQVYNYVGNYSLTEASAESYLKYSGSTVLDIKDLYYYYERRSEALLLTLGLFRDVTIEDYYNATHDCDAYAYYRFFDVDVESEKELKRFGNILYSIDAINLQNYFYWSHNEEITSAYFDEIVSFVGQAYKVDIFKMILTNMMNYTVLNSDFSLTDNIVLVNVIKSIIVQEASGDPWRAYQIIFDADSAEAIIELEEIYIDFLSEYYEVSKEEIRRLEQDTNVRRKISALTAICSEQDYIESEEKQYATNLIERFPLLKQILIMYPIELTEWNDFLTAHGESLSKKSWSSYRLATPSFINASSSNFRFAPSREERRHPGTTIDTEVVNTTLVQACFESKQHERILNKTAVRKGQGKGQKYTKANPKLARFTKTPKTYKRIQHRI